MANRKAVLTDRYIQSIKPEEKEKFYSDYDSLYLRVGPSSEGGGKTWRFRYNKTSKSLGKYDANLAEVREEVREYRKKLAKGIDPFKKKKKKLEFASDFVEAYANLKKLDKESAEYKKVDRDVTCFITSQGDRAPHEYGKADINEFISERLEVITKKGTPLKTGAVRRELNSISAVFNFVYEEHEIDHFHRFRKLKVPNENEDRKEREDFTSDQLNILREIVAGSDNIREQIIGLLIDTGMRSSEAVGLASGDIKLGKIPHIVLHRNPLRRLKTKNSQRIIPLVGSSLSAARCLDRSNEWLFPKYLKTLNGKSSANTAVNKRLRRILGPSSPTSHSFRHTLKTRLRNFECPGYMQDELGGWSKNISDMYGTPTDIKNKAEYIEKSLDWVTEIL
jgi:integrase